MTRRNVTWASALATGLLLALSGAAESATAAVAALALSPLTLSACGGDAAAEGDGELIADLFVDPAPLR